MLRGYLHAVIIALISIFFIPESATAAPSAIKVGTLYASSGAFAAISMPMYDGLKLWADRVNDAGGVYVKPYKRRIPIKLIAYDDMSNPSTATTLYNELITRDKVDILVSDSGSVLTSVAVPLAREHKMLLIDQSGTGAAFFSRSNPYIVLITIPVSDVWPKYVAGFLTTKGIKRGIRRVAILYATNDFSGAQAKALAAMIRRSGTPLKVVFNYGVPTSTSNYLVLLHNIQAVHPDAVLELGYPNNDIAYLRALEQSGIKFKWQFAIFPGLAPVVMKKAVGLHGLSDVYTYVTSASYPYKVNYGMTLPLYRNAWEKKYGGGKVPFNFNSVAGYTTGLVLQKALGTTHSMRQLDLRKAIFAQSGKLRTINGSFRLNSEGAQIGEVMPLGQVRREGKDRMKLVIVYPPRLAAGSLGHSAK